MSGDVWLLSRGGLGAVEEAMSEPLTREEREGLRCWAAGNPDVPYRMAQFLARIVDDLERVERERDGKGAEIALLKAEVASLRSEEMHEQDVEESLTVALYERDEARAMLTKLKTEEGKAAFALANGWPLPEELMAARDRIAELEAKLARIVDALEVLSEESGGFPVPGAIPEAHKERLLVLRGHIADVHALALAKGDK